MPNRKPLFLFLKLLLGLTSIGLAGCQARQSETLLFETIEKSHFIGYQDKSADLFILTRPEDINQVGDWLFDGGARLAAVDYTSSVVIVIFQGVKGWDDTFEVKSLTRQGDTVQIEIEFYEAPKNGPVLPANSSAYQALAIEKQDGDWEREIKFKLTATNRWFFGIEHTVYVPLAVEQPVTIATLSSEAGNNPYPEPIQAATLAQPVEPNATVLPGDLYLLLSTVSTPYRFSFVRLPLACLARAAACSTVETLPGFPETNFSIGTPLFPSWSPDGKVALLYNSNTQQMSVFDPLAKAYRTLASDLPLVRDQIVWNPDGSWAVFSVQGADEFSASLTLFNSASRERRTPAIALEGMQVPIGWLNAQELLFLVQTYAYPDGDSTQKKVPDKYALYAANPMGGELRPVLENILLRGDSFPQLSPDGKRILLSQMVDEQPSLDVINLDGQVMQSLGDAIDPVWSPDGKWAVAISQRGVSQAVMLFDPNSGEARPLFESQAYLQPIWLPSSDYLLVITRGIDPQTGEDRTPLFLVSVPDGNAWSVTLPGIDPTGWNIAAASIRPAPVLPYPAAEILSTAIPAPTLTPTAQLVDKPDGEEVTLLLRNRTQPSELQVVGLGKDCLAGEASCEQSNRIAALPVTLPQVLKLFWTADGERAFFWDSDTGDIYILDGASGEINKFRAAVWKPRSDFFISPNGSRMVFEIEAGVFETDIMSMDMQTGEMLTLNTSAPGMKFVSTWLNDEKFLFWSEKYTGDKGYLEDVEVYTFDFATQATQPFEIGRDWMQISIPRFSPDRQAMVLTHAGSIIIRDAVNAQERVLSINPENYIWSADSSWLVVYTQDKKLFVASADGQDALEVYAFPQHLILTDWLWLPGSEDLIFVMSDEEGKTAIARFSLSNYAVTPVILPLLETYDVVSLSYRPRPIISGTNK